jgi:hypothetical protein
MGRLMALFAERLQFGSSVADRILEWPGDVGPTGHSVPLRLASALHGLVLERLALTEVYPPHPASDDALWAALVEAFDTQTKRIHRWLDSPPQTNEVRRSAALILGANLLSQRFGLPLVLSELGASAGLNLNFDRYRLGPYGDLDSTVSLTPDLFGSLPPVSTLRVMDRAGVDLNPLDPNKDQLRLLAYLWPDQPERLALTRAALALGPPKPDRGDAAEWLDARLSQPRKGALHLVYHTVAWQYFPAETKQNCNEAMTRASENATLDAPIAHLGIEADKVQDGAALTLTTWPGGKIETLARVDFHGRWIKFL